MTNVNMVDFVILGLLLVSAFIGIARGFTREVLGIGSWVGALFAAIYGLVYARPFISAYIHNTFVADVVSGLVIFVIALFILGSISRHISKGVKGSVLGGLDRSLGFIFGVARGGVVVVIAYFIATLTSDPEKWPEEIKNAKSYPHVLRGAHWLRSLVPAEALKNLEQATPKKEELETEAKKQTVDTVVSALSQPKANAPKTETESDKKDDTGYKDSERSDMERLVKNNDKKTPK